jgi:hypothetical protein
MLARAQVAIVAARDSMNVQRAKQANKTAQAQEQLNSQLRAQIGDILKHVGLTDTEYQRRTFLVSSDSASRRIFDSVVVAVTGAPLPGYAARASGCSHRTRREQLQRNTDTAGAAPCGNRGSSNSRSARNAGRSSA